MIHVKTNIDSKKDDLGDITLKVKSQEGVIKEEVTESVDSFVQQFWEWVYACVSDNSRSITTVEGGSASIFPGRDFDSFSLVVGTGTTSVSIDDFSLESRIVDGNSGGELSYGSHSTNKLTDVSDEVYLQVTRVFQNNSGVSIDINEVGFVSIESGNNWLMARDILDNPVTVPDGDEVQVIYNLKINEGLNNARIIVAVLDGDLYSITDTSGSTQNRGSADFVYDMGNEDESETEGPVVGAGNTTVSPDDFQMDSLIERGTNAGELIYSTFSLSSLDIDTANDMITFELNRDIINSSGSDITIREVGLISTSFDPILSFRRVLPAPITLSDGEGRPLRWTWNISV